MLYSNMNLKDFFCNILSERWLSDKTFSHFSNQKTLNQFKEQHVPSKRNLRKGFINFDYNKIKEIIWDSIYLEHHYMIGKTESYYFLATYTISDVYPYVEILKNDTITPLIKEITHFSKMYPDAKPTVLARYILLDNKLEKKEDVKEKRTKI